MNAELQLVTGRRKAVWGSRVRAGATLAAALLATSCSDAVRTGQASSYLVIQSLAVAAGSSVVFSDVRNVDEATGAQSVINDNATASFIVQMKDVNGLAPSPVNAITITQYRVVYTRTDGRNTQGVDVPYAFDGAVTQTISSSGSVGFTVVRNQAKLEAPLSALAATNIPISTIATITFYGHDQTGREVSVTGRMDVTFANFPG